MTYCLRDALIWFMRYRWCLISLKHLCWWECSCSKSSMYLRLQSYDAKIYKLSKQNNNKKTNCLLGKLNNDLAIMTDNLPPNLETHGWVHPIRWPMCRYYSWPCLLLLFVVLFAGYGKRRPLQLWGGIWLGLSFVINPIRRWTIWTITNKMTLAGAGGTVSKIQSRQFNPM